MSGASGTMGQGTLQIDWAASSSNPAGLNPVVAVGPPNAGTGANTGDGYSITHSDFGVGQGNSRTYPGFASVFPSGSFATADFIALEINGTPGIGFESSFWTFTSGSSSLTVHYPNALAGGHIVGVGSLTPAVYETLFKLPANSATGEWAYILFDVDGLNSGVNPFASDFAVRVVAPGDVKPDGTKDFGSPDLDAMGRISLVPEPGVLPLAVIGLAGVIRLRRRG